MGDYNVARLDEISVMDLSETDYPIDHDIRDIDAALDTEDLRVKLWYFEPGEEIQIHAHEEQEELYYVIDGEFELTLGDPDDPEVVTVGPDSFYAAGPEVGHGHRYVGDDRGVILAIAAPGVHDPARDPREFDG